MIGVIGTVTLFAGNFAPLYWAFCNGQILPISQNTALFSILGTYYGGDGRVTFGLPDLRGRAVVGTGQGPGTSLYDLGEVTGVETGSMLPNQMPAHVHPVQVVVTPVAATSGTVDSPAGGCYASNSEQLFNSASDGFGSPYDAALGMQNIGNGQPFSILHPVLGLNYIICLAGSFPARN